MARTQVLLGVLFCIGVFVEVSSEEVPFTECHADSYNGDFSSSASPNTTPPKTCSISTLRVTPCPEFTTAEPYCTVKRGTTITIEFDFVPKKSAQSLTGRAFWTTALVESPLVSMDTNACNYTVCPIRPNKIYTYTYVLLINQRFPARAYDVKWKLWSDELECCFLTKVKLVR